MNVKLIQNEMNCCTLTLHTVLKREETLEMIVPDACPDILEVVDTDAVPRLEGKECAPGALSLRGTAACTVLYQPEGGGRLCCLHAELPFRFNAELEQATGQSRCVVQTWVQQAETRALNPRKVLLRVNLAFDVTLYEPDVLRCCTGLEQREALGIEQRLEERRGSFVVHISERPFSCVEEAQIPGSRPAIGELLRTSCRAFVSESRVLGEKLVIKGGAAVHLLYLSREEKLCSAELELPFSQVAEIGTVEGEAQAQIVLCVTSSRVEETDDEGRGLSVELELLAQIVIRDERCFSLVTDAYSTCQPGLPEFASCPLPTLAEQGTRRQTVREVLETPAPTGEVCEVRVYPGPVRSAGDETAAELRLAVLYRGEEERYCEVSRMIQVKCPAELAEGSFCLGSCSVPETDAMPVSGGIEVRLAVDFQLQVLELREVSVLSGFSLEQDNPMTLEERPSVVLRQIARGETLWDIAKAYRTTEAEIIEANGLEEEPVQPEQLLLIPKKR